jgi:hypothetical protein
MPASALRAIGSRFQARYEKEIHDFNGSVRDPDGNRATRSGLRQELRMFHGQRPSLGQMDIERLKRPRLVHFSQLFDGHSNECNRLSGPVKCEPPRALLSRRFGESR